MSEITNILFYFSLLLFECHCRTVFHLFCADHDLIFLFLICLVTSLGWVCGFILILTRSVDCLIYVVSCQHGGVQQHNIPVFCQVFNSFMIFPFLRFLVVVGCCWCFYLSVWHFRLKKWGHHPWLFLLIHRKSVLVLLKVILGLVLSAWKEEKFWVGF